MTARQSHEGPRTLSGRSGPPRGSPPALWAALFSGWEAQQVASSPHRDRRLDAIVDVVEAALPRRARVLDLGAGPGPLAARILDRCPGFRVVAVDVDPVVLRIGREHLGDRGGRLTWVRADLARPGWASALPRGRFDAAVSSTALHWLRRRELPALYGGLATALRPGGLFLDGDHLPWQDARLDALARRIAVRRRRRAGRGAWGVAWERWWQRAARRPELRAEFEERRRRFASSHPVEERVPLEAHLRALRRAGFASADIVWQEFGDRVLLAVR